MTADQVAVLDIGTSKVLGLVAELDERGEPQVRAISSTPTVGVQRGVITEIEPVGAAIDIVTRRLAAEVGPIQQYVVGLGGVNAEGTSSRGFKPMVPRGRSVTHQDVLEVVQHSRAILFPPDRHPVAAIPQEFRVDGQVVPSPVGLSGTKLEVSTYVVSGPVSHLHHVEAALQSVNLEVDQMALSSLAAGMGVLTAPEVETGAIVVDIGAGTTDVAVFRHGTIQGSVGLPVGGGHVTSDLMKLLKTTPEEAERLKLLGGNALARLVPEQDSLELMQIGSSQARVIRRRVLCEIIESRMREIATLVQQNLHRMGLEGPLPGGIVLTGGGARMAGVTELFEQIVGQRARTGEPTVRLAGAPRYGNAVAVGLATYMLQSGDELATARGADWKDRVKSLWSLISRK